MSFNSDFEIEFIKRTKDILNDYKGEHDVSILLNCLLGLLIIPKEQCFKLFPETALDGSWGIKEINVISHTLPSLNHKNVITKMRNPLAHLRFRPVPIKGKVESISFKDRGDFELVIELENLKILALKVADVALSK